jgi:hypothetical protein
VLSILRRYARLVINAICQSRPARLLRLLPPRARPERGHLLLEEADQATREEQDGPDEEGTLKV